MQPPRLLHRSFPLLLAGNFLLPWAGLAAAPGATAPTAAIDTPSAATARAVSAAQKFLATLDKQQQAAAVFPFTDETQRKRWSNLPVAMVKRAGLRLGDLSPAQRKAAMEALAALLSPQGYAKVVDMVEADEVLRNSPDNQPNLKFGRDEFYLSFVGAPSNTAPWMLQFGGHHLAINVTVAGVHGALTPSLTAAQPATYQLNGKTIRPLGAENDRAFALINALDPAQQTKAIIGSAFRDLVLGPGKDGVTIVPEGIKAGKLNPAQQQLLWALCREWVGLAEDSAAEAKMAEIKANVAETYFAWSGPTTPGSAAYFRIQGPTLVIEYAPQNLGGVPTNHIHTIYRDPTNDYGAKWWPH